MSFPDLITPVYDRYKSRIKRIPCHSNRASSLGETCVRVLVYDRTRADQAELHGVDLQVIFEEGNLHEEAVLRTLRDCGFQVIEQQTFLEWKQYQITAHLDAVVVVGQPPIGLPLEIKSMSPHIFDSIFRRGPGVYTWEEVGHLFTKPWLRKYLAQIQLYALLKGVEQGGILLCKNKATGALAQVNVPLDLVYAESLIQRAEQINRHVAEGTLPDRIPWDEETCGSCRYLSICLPDRVGVDPLAFLEDDTVTALLEERAASEESGREFDRLDKRAKAWAKARPESKIVVGNWLVQKSGTPARTIVKFDRIAS